MKNKLPTVTLTAACCLAWFSGQAGTFYSDFNNGVPDGTAVYDLATVSPNDGTGGGVTNSGCLQLVTELGSGPGSFVVTNDLDAGVPIASFTATFKALIGSLGNGADGLSFNFAPDLPAGGLGEEGAGTGLTVEFDTYPNVDVGDHAPAVDISVGGIEVATTFFPGLRPGRFVDVVIQLKPNKTLDVIYDGMYAYSNYDLSAYTPASGSLFGFGARCGSTTDNHFIDNLSILTQTNAAAFVDSFAPKGRQVPRSSSLDLVLKDLGTQVNTNTIVLKLDGTQVVPVLGAASGQTTIHFAPSQPFAPYTPHNVSLSFTDSAGKSTAFGYSFTVQADWVAVFSDGFESYTANNSPLDMNYAAGPNAAPNGGPGNPWFGPSPPNARVIGTENNVSPHSGNNMIRGSAAGDFDENWYNLPYRQHNQVPFTGNIMLDWWFYDPLGEGGSTYKEYIALGWYNLCPVNTDYPGTGSLNASGQIQRLCLGADSNQAGSFDNTKYQTRVVSADDGYNAGGWFNVPVSRSVGWHHGRIAIEGKVPNSAANVLFYVDDMSAPCFVHNSILVYGGYNVIEINTAYGTTFGYFDDLTFSVARPPRISTIRSGNNLVLTWPGDGFVLQSAQDVLGTFTDVAGATSGYSYDTTTGATQFFRLRN